MSAIETVLIGGPSAGMPITLTRPDFSVLVPNPQNPNKMDKYFSHEIAGVNDEYVVYVHESVSCPIDYLIKNYKK